MNRLFCMLLLWFVPQLAQAQAVFESNLENGRCVSDYCVIFSVSIEMDSFVETPVTVQNSFVFTFDDSESNFDTVVSLAGDECSKEVTIPRDTFNAIQAVMASIAGSGNEPVPVLTPAQQSLLLFYTTIMQQTLSFTCDQRDLEPQIIDPDGEGSGNSGSGGSGGSGGGGSGGFVFGGT